MTWRKVKYTLNEIERKMYMAICRHDGIKAKEIAKETGADKGDINHLLYGSPFIHDLCYADEDFRWHGLIRQMRPHIGLGDFYGTVRRFLDQPAEEWLEELKEGCRGIGRNLNDTRGLLHSFADTRETMASLFRDLETMDGSGRLDYDSWEICFELRIRRASFVRIYADVLVITEDKVFSLEFKMKDQIDPDELRQSAKYSPYLEIIFGPGYDIIPALVLTGGAELFEFVRVGQADALVPVCSGDMLFNVFDEYMGFLR